MPKRHHTGRSIALVLCLAIDIGTPALFAALEPAQPAVVSTIAAPPAGEAQDPNDAAGATVPGGADAAAPSPAQISAPAPRIKEPRKEESDPRKRRFFRTPGGVMLMIVVGALVVGGATQAALNAGNSP